MDGNDVLTSRLITNKENCPLQKWIRSQGYSITERIYDTQKDFIEIPTDTFSKLKTKKYYW